MALQDLVLDQLAIARDFVRKGHEVVPAWRIACADGLWIILTPFDKSEQRDRAVRLVQRFMVWKLAQSYVQTEEIRLKPVMNGRRHDAVAAAGCSRSERVGAMHRIKRTGRTIEFGPLEWLRSDQVDALCPALPGRQETVTAEEVAELESLCGERGEILAIKMS
jgi:hypothetical protein